MITHRLRYAAASLAVTAGIFATAATPAVAQAINDHPNSSLSTSGTTGGYDGATVHIWRSSGTMKVNVQLNSGGAHHHSAQARAQCKRANGGTSWYESTIVSSDYNKQASHYDCYNNGTYDAGLVGFGTAYN